MPRGHASNIEPSYSPGILLVVFNDGAVYEYYGVSPDVFADFEMASSKGGYFNEYIRGQYTYRRLSTLYGSQLAAVGVGVPVKAASFLPAALQNLNIAEKLKRAFPWLPAGIGSGYYVGEQLELFGDEESK